MADEPEIALTPEEAAAQAEVVSLLASMQHLRPDESAADASMPEPVWARLREALAAEAAVTAGSAAATAPVGLPAAAPSATATVTPIRRRTQWASGLVAASVAVVAVGIGVGVLRQDTTESVTAATAPSAEAMAALPAPSTAAAESAGAALADAPADAAKAEEPQEPASVGGTSPESVTTSPPTLELRASGEPPARVVLASSTNYTPADLPGQVSSLFARMGVDSPEEAMAMPVEPAAMPIEDGFTASWQALADCVGWLTGSPDGQALVVDRAQFLGTDAGVVVAPGGDWIAVGEASDPNPASPAPTLTVSALTGSLDVWVVDPECQQSVGSIKDYLDYRWQE